MAPKNKDKNERESSSGGSNRSQGDNQRNVERNQRRTSTRSNMDTLANSASAALGDLKKSARRMSTSGYNTAKSVVSKAAETTGKVKDKVVDKTVKAGYFVSAVRDEFKNRKKFPEPTATTTTSTRRSSPPPSYKEPEFTDKFKEIAKKTMENEYRKRNFMDIVGLVGRQIKAYNDETNGPLVGVDDAVIYEGGYKYPPVEEDFLHALQPAEVALLGEIVGKFKKELEKKNMFLDDEVVDLIVVNLVKIRAENPGLYRDATSAELRAASSGGSLPPELPSDDEADEDEVKPLPDLKKGAQSSQTHLSFRGDRNSVRNSARNSTRDSKRESSRASSRGSRRVPSGAFVRPESYNQAIGGRPKFAFLEEIQNMRQSFRPDNDSGRKSPPRTKSPKNRGGSSGGSNKDV